VAIYPENLPEDVDAALAMLGLKGESVLTVHCASPNVSERHRRTFEQRVTARQIVASVLDLFGRPSKSFCSDLARFANLSDQKALRRLASPAGADEWTALVDGCPTFFDLMKKFSSARPQLEQLLSFVPLIKPRIYSIASDDKYKPDCVEFTVVINQWKTKGTGEMKTGTCTKFIQRAAVGTKIPCSVICGTFQFPADDTTHATLCSTIWGLVVSACCRYEVVLVLLCSSAFLYEF
jgi:sulfite reductase alpha subunit-like flavoprotein